MSWLLDALRGEAKKLRVESEMQRRNGRGGPLAAEWRALSECHAAAAEVYERKLAELEKENV